MEKRMQDFVREGYEKGDYIKSYDRNGKKLDSFEEAFFEEFEKRAKGSVLDLGCGGGVPYDRELLKRGFSVTGIDISEKHIKSAIENVEGAVFMTGDFSDYDFKKKFDAIVSFYAIFHIPREEHVKLLEKMHTLLNNNGILLITMGADDMKLETEEFAGSEMAWSSYGAERNKEMVESAGFRIIASLEDYREERHLWVLAEKR